jgi:hypothetical protein
MLSPIKDDPLAQPVKLPSLQSGRSNRDAAGLAATGKTEPPPAAAPVQDRLAQLWVRDPLPPATGQIADKMLFDALSGAP